MNDAASLPPRHAFSVVVSHDTDTNSYIADVPALGIGTYGFSRDHAFDMAEEAISLWIETAQEDGVPIPVEDHPVEVRQVAVQDRSRRAGCHIQARLEHRHKNASVTS